MLENHFFNSYLTFNPTAFSVTSAHTWPAINGTMEGEGVSSDSGHWWIWAKNHLPSLHGGKFQMSAITFNLKNKRRKKNSVVSYFS